MSADAVRLWRHNSDTDFRARHWMLRDDDAQRSGITQYIALPASQHAELVALLGEARGALAAKVGGHHFRAGDATGFSEEGIEITYGPDVHIVDCPACRRQEARDALLSRLDAALARLGGGAQGAPRQGGGG